MLVNIKGLIIENSNKRHKGTICCFVKTLSHSLVVGHSNS